MMLRSTGLAGIALLLALGGCKDKGKDKEASGGGAAAGGLASCNTPTLNECTEYNQANRALGDEHLKKICDIQSGAFATTGCPAEKRAGVCKKDEGTTVFYEGYAIPMDKLKTSCTDRGGKWLEP